MYRNKYVKISCFWRWMKSEVDKRIVDAPGEMLARILDAAAVTSKHEHQRQTRDFCTRDAEFINVDGGIVENLL